MMRRMTDTASQRDAHVRADVAKACHYLLNARCAATCHTFVTARQDIATSSPCDRRYALHTGSRSVTIRKSTGETLHCPGSNRVHRRWSQAWLHVPCLRGEWTPTGKESVIRVR